MRRLSLALLIGLGLSSMPYQVWAQLPDQKPIRHSTPATCNQNWDAIKQQLEKAALTIDKRHVADGYQLLGHNLQKCKQLDAALSAYRRGQTFHASSHSTYQIAKILVKQQKFTQALSVYRQGRLIDGSTTGSALELEALTYDDLAEALVQEGNLDRAIAMYRYAIQIDAQNDMRWYNLGRVYIQQKRYQQAFTAFQQVEELRDSTSLTEQQLDARAYYRVASNIYNPSPQRAVFLKKSIELDPDFEGAYFILGEHYFEDKQWDLALATYRRFLELSPDNTVVHQNMGSLLVRKGDLDNAFSHFRTLIQLDQREVRKGPAIDSAAYVLLAGTLRYQHKPADTVKAYQKALALTPEDIGTHAQLGAYLSELGRLDEAIVYLKQAHELVNRPTPKTPLFIGSSYSMPERVTSLLADTLAKSGRPHDAIRILRQAKANSLTGPLTITTLSKVLSQVGQHQEARNILQSVYPTKTQFEYADPPISDEARLIAKHGEIYFELQQYDKALQHYDEAIQLEPKFPLAHYYRGDVLRQLGHFDRAIEAYQTSLRLRSHSLDVTHKTYSGLGWSLFERKQVETAISAFKQAIRLNPQNSAAHYGLGKALLTQQQRAKAIQHLQTAFELNPRHPGLSEDLQKAKDQLNA